MTTHLPRVRTRLGIHAHRKVRGLLEGEYAALHTGRSMDFQDLREYVRGDDVTDLEWKASARTGALLVKRYAAVRKHTIMLAVSTGRSMAAMNDLDVPKRELSVFAAGVLGYLAVRNGDFVGLTYGDAAHQGGLPPATGELRLERCLATAFDATTPGSAPTDLVALLRYVARVVRRRTILVVVGDDLTMTDELAAALRRLVVQHEVLFLTVGDLDPTAAPVAAGVRERGRALVDVETGLRLPDWLDDARLHEELAGSLAEDLQAFRRRTDAVGVVHEHVHDTESAINAVFRLLERQRHARRR